MKKVMLWVLSVISLVFGLVTLFMSTSVIFDLFGIREMEGNYVDFVVYGNFILGFCYVAASYGFFKQTSWTATLLLFSMIFLLVILLGFVGYIFWGGIYETKTIFALIFRLVVTGALVGGALFYIRNSNIK